MPNQLCLNRAASSNNKSIQIFGYAKQSFSYFPTPLDSLCPQEIDDRVKAFDTSPAVSISVGPPSRWPLSSGLSGPTAWPPADPYPAALPVTTPPPQKKRKRTCACAVAWKMQPGNPIRSVWPLEGAKFWVSISLNSNWSLVDRRAPKIGFQLSMWIQLVFAQQLITIFTEHFVWLLWPPLSLMAFPQTKFPRLSKSNVQFNLLERVQHDPIRTHGTTLGQSAAASHCQLP